MTRLSLHIGLNHVDRTVWGDQITDLKGCENDARAMTHIAASQGFTPIQLITMQATVQVVWNQLLRASQQLTDGDYFFLTYSGHGGRIADNDAGEEVDRYDETWCLYDGQLLDDMLYSAIARFTSGVRVFVLSDSCHSGTVTRNAAARATQPYLDVARDAAGPVLKILPTTVTQREYDEHRSQYARMILPGEQRPPSADAKVILISGCRDNQTSKDGDENGQFTAAFLRIWDNGSYNGDFNQLVAVLQQQLVAFDQTPNLFAYGAGVADMALQVPLSE